MVEDSDICKKLTAVFLVLEGILELNCGLHWIFHLHTAEKISRQSCVNLEVNKKECSAFPRISESISKIGKTD